MLPRTDNNKKYIINKSKTILILIEKNYPIPINIKNENKIIIFYNFENGTENHIKTQVISEINISTMSMS